jgi:hypothetical protein
MACHPLGELRMMRRKQVTAGTRSALGNATSTMTADFQQLIETKLLSPQEVAVITRSIYDTLLRESKYLGGGNFTRIHPEDIRRLFDLYDGLYFDGGVRKLLGNTPLHFRLSKRMTQAGGNAGRREFRDRSSKTVRTEYEIAISAVLLFQSFQKNDRPIVMSGIQCRDRLEALQRIVEHETIHLIEMLIWVQSSCSAPRFQSIANRFFGHTDHRHQLITPRERALTKFGIKPGDRVSFRIDGQHHVGIVNRITKRATVLVEDSRGQPYSNGKHYAAFYIPVEMLERVEG